MAGVERAAAANNLFEMLFRALIRFPLLLPAAPESEGVKTSVGEAVKRPTEKRDFEGVDDAREGTLETGREREPERMLRDGCREGVGEGGAGRDELTDIPETRDRDRRAALIGGVPSTPVLDTSPTAAGATKLACWLLSRFFFSEGELECGKDVRIGDGEAFAEVAPL